MAKPLDFKDFVVVDYRPGEVASVKYAAQKRHKQQGAGTNAEYASYDPSMGKHKPGVSMGYTGKHTTVKDPANKKHHSHVFLYKGESVEFDEALTVAQRLLRKRQMVRNKAKIKLGKERAKRRMANPEKLSKRAVRQARMVIFKKLTKDIPKDELSYARRQEIEKRLDKPAIKQRIKQIARKLLPQVRKKEIERRRTPNND